MANCRNALNGSRSKLSGVVLKSPASTYTKVVVFTWRAASALSRGITRKRAESITGILFTWTGSSSSLGYYPEKQNWDGKFRKIQIVTQEHGYKVYARKGYYAHPKYQAMR
jgi:hypothetical protein